MLQQGVLLAWTAMAAGVKAVSKRLGRMYVEDEGEAEKDASRYQPKKAPVYDDPEVGSATRKQSISTATSQSSLSSQSSRQTSLEAAPLVATEKVDLTTRTTSPESFGHGIYGSRAEVVDMFGSVQGFAAFTNPGPDVTLPAGRPIDCFGTVVPGVYRSSFPQAEDYAFMEALKLKTVVTLVQKDFPAGYHAFMSKNGIKHHVFDMKGTKKEDIPIRTMKSILRLVLDRRNHPVLIHCNHGRHRTGCVVAAVRKVSGWHLGRILQEYENYASPKIRDCDIRYITGFEISHISNISKDNGWQFRPCNFLRTAIFAFFVLIIWLLSCARIVETPKRKVSE